MCGAGISGGFKTLNIVVCVKQVPGVAVIDINPETGTLRRDGVEAKLNPYDLFAVEAALEFSEKVNGNVTALSMGPPQARDALLETLYMGADQAVLLSDQRFAGSDVLATAHTLSQALSIIGFDIVICGKQTTDGDTAQVGAELAEFLGIPHVTGVLEIKSGNDGSGFGGECICDGGGKNVGGRTGGFTGERTGGCTSGLGTGITDGLASELTDRLTGEPIGEPIGGLTGERTGGLTVITGQDSQIATYYITLPCLLCTDGGINTPRLPSYKRKRGIAPYSVRIMNLEDFGDQDAEHYGLSGSPTQVERTFPPEVNLGHELISGDSDAIAERLADVFAEMKFL